MFELKGGKKRGALGFFQLYLSLFIKKVPVLENPQLTSIRSHFQEKVMWSFRDPNKWIAIEETRKDSQPVMIFTF